MVDRAAKELGAKLSKDIDHEAELKVAAIHQSPNLNTTASDQMPKISPAITANRRQFRTNRFLVQVIDENEALEESVAEPEKRPMSPESAAYLASSPTTLISNTQSLDCETRASLLKEFKRHNGLFHQISDVGLKKTNICDVNFDKTDLNKKKENEDMTQNEMMQKIKSNKTSGLKRSSSGETTMKNDTMSILNQMGMQN